MQAALNIHSFGLPSLDRWGNWAQKSDLNMFDTLAVKCFSFVHTLSHHSNPQFTEQCTQLQQVTEVVTGRVWILVWDSNAYCLHNQSRHLTTALGMQRTRCRLFSWRLSLPLSLSSSSAKWDEHSRVSQGACVGLTFCDCWKSKSLTRTFPMKNSEESVLSSTSTTLLYESHFAYNHPVKHRALPHGLSVSRTSVLQMK